jgi:enamine deaminase RidA (YjgF/YER057c/UK114 family)
LTKIEGLLKEAGTNKSNLLTAQIWLKDIEKDFAAMNTVWSAWLDPVNKPVRATIQAPMARPAILVEIKVTAAAAAVENDKV